MKGHVLQPAFLGDLLEPALKDTGFGVLRKGRTDDIPFRAAELLHPRDQKDRKRHLPKGISEINKSGYFFVNPNAAQLSDQAIRRMIKKYCSLASIDLHITPHMFRHTFATSLLEADVDIRYIQEMLGHSSITVTEIYRYSN